MITCPACGNDVHVSRGWIVETRIDIKLDWIFWCTRCPMVSEVNHDTGMLVDLGNVTLAQLNEGLDEPMAFMVANPPLLRGRIDS